MSFGRCVKQQKGISVNSIGPDILDSEKSSSISNFFLYVLHLFHILSNDYIFNIFQCCKWPEIKASESFFIYKSN